MEHDRKPLQGRIDKLYKLRAQGVDAGDRRNSNHRFFVDILAAEDAAGKRKVLAKLFDKDRELARRRKFISAVGKRYLAVECRSVTLILCRIERAAQE